MNFMGLLHVRETPEKRIGRSKGRGGRVKEELAFRTKGKLAPMPNIVDTTLGPI